MTLNRHLTISTFPVMSRSCPCQSFQLPLHVPDIFSVCPCHFPCMSRSFVASHFPTSPVVPIGFIALCFPVIPPALVFISVTVTSLSVPLCFPFISRCFPDMWTSYFLPYFLALPCSSPWLPSISHKITVFSSVFAKRTSKNTAFFPDFLQKQAGNPNQQKAGRGNRPLFCDTAPRRLRLVERHQITARYVGGETKPCVIDVSWGRTKGGGYPLSSLRYPTRRTMSADMFFRWWHSYINGFSTVKVCIRGHGRFKCVLSRWATISLGEQSVVDSWLSCSRNKSTVGQVDKGRTRLVVFLPSFRLGQGCVKSNFVQVVVSYTRRACCNILVPHQSKKIDRVYSIRPKSGKQNQPVAFDQTLPQETLQTKGSFAGTV